MNATVIEIRQLANDRIATCDIHLNHRALVSHNWAVVSSLWNCRGVYLTTDPATGGKVTALGPYPNRMPSLYERDAAESLAGEWNDNSDTETLRVVDAMTWWQTERDEAARILESLEAHA